MRKKLVLGWVVTALLLVFAFTACPNGGDDPIVIRDAASPQILGQPASRLYFTGQTAVPMRVIAVSPDNGVLEYQWYRADSATGVGTRIESATADSFTPTIPTAITDEVVSWYYVVVTNRNTAANGIQTASLTSNRAEIRVVEAPPGLPLTFAVNAAGNAFVGTFYTGETVPATLGPRAEIVEGMQLNNITPIGRVVNTGGTNSGFIALGNAVGDILNRLETWTMETIVFVPANYGFVGGGHHILGFAEVDNLSQTVQTGPTMWLRGDNLSLNVRTQGWSGNEATTGEVDDNIPDVRGAWRHIVITQGANLFRVYMDGNLVSQAAHTGLTTTNLPIFEYGYLGRSIFHANDDSTLRNTLFRSFSIDEGEMTPALMTARAAEIDQLLHDLNGAAFIFAVAQDIQLQEGSEYVDAGATIGSFVATHGRAPFTYTFVAGIGDTHNSYFTIAAGNELRVGSTALDGGDHRIRVRVTDGEGATYERAVTIRIIEEIDPNTGIRLWFTFDNPSGNTVFDRTFNHTGTLHGDATVIDMAGHSVLALGSGQPWFDLGADAGSIIAGPDVTAFTISAYIFVGDGPSLEGGDAAGFQPWSFTRTGSIDGSGNQGVIYQIRTGSQEINHVTGNQARNWTHSGTGWNRNQWVHMVYTHVNGGGNANSTGTIFINGTQLVQNTGTFRTNRTDAGTMGDLVYNFLGRPSRGTTGYMTNTRYADFRVYNRALTPVEVADLSTELHDRFAYLRLASVIEVVANSPLVSSFNGVIRRTIPLPTSQSGVNITWVSSNPAVVTNDGVVTPPASGELESILTLTATFSIGVHSTSVEFEVIVLPEADVAGIITNELIYHLTIDTFMEGEEGEEIAVERLNTRVGRTVQGSNSVTFQNGVDGGRAAVFNNNTNRFLTVTNEDESPLLAGVEEFSVAFWTRSDHARASWKFFAARDNLQMGPPEFYLGDRIQNNQFHAERFYNGRATPASATLGSGAGTVALGVWNHVAVVHGTDFVEMYFNGTLVSRANVTQPVSAILGETPVLFIGRATWGANGEVATGAIQDYRIYRGTLNAEQIRALYSSRAQ
ncbi:MAG: hypothetical protein FWC97_00100 [Treponema sp.]|nr:hypothetical protein [Treponema sp.]